MRKNARIVLRRPIPKKITRRDAKEYDRLYAEELRKVQPLIDAAEASGRITTEDLAVIINY